MCHMEYLIGLYHELYQLGKWVLTLIDKAYVVPSEQPISSVNPFRKVVEQTNDSPKPDSEFIPFDL